MTYKNPPTATDIIIQVYNSNSQGNTEFKGIALIKRLNEPFKGQWAIPGGFQEWGESLETTAIREAKEETSLDVELLVQLSTYSNPDRDPRGPVNGIGYVAKATGIPCGADDAKEAKVFPFNKIPYPLAFDHDKRLQEYFKWYASQSWDEHPK